jgi:hypothetical protein
VGVIGVNPRVLASAAYGHVEAALIDELGASHRIQIDRSRGQPSRFERCGWCSHSQDLCEGRGAVEDAPAIEFQGCFVAVDPHHRGELMVGDLQLAVVVWIIRDPFESAWPGDRLHAATRVATRRTARGSRDHSINIAEERPARGDSGEAVKANSCSYGPP